MKNPTRDITLFFILTNQTALYYAFGLFMPYFYSYLYHKNPALSLKIFIIQGLFYNLGIPIGNFIVSKMIKQIGIKGFLNLGSICYFFICLSYLYIEGPITLFLNGIVSGVALQFIVVPTNLYFQVNYSQQAEKYISTAFMSIATGQIVWCLAASVIINPDNIGLINVVTTGGEKQKVFPESLMNNTELFFYIYGVLMVIITAVCSLLIGDTEKYRFRLFCSNSSAEELNLSGEDKDLINKSLSIGRSSFSSKEHEDKDLYEVELIDKEVKEEQSNTKEIEQEVAQVSSSLRFYVLLLTSIIRMATFMYIGTNIKNMFFNISNNDFIVTVIPLFTITIMVFTNLFAGRIWILLGPINSYIVSILANIACDLLYIFFSNSFTALTVICFLERPVVGANFIFNYLTPFTFYKKEVALHLLKYYDSLFFWSFAIGVAFNFMTEGNDYTKPVIGLLACDTVGLLLVVFYLRNTFKKEVDPPVSNHTVVWNPPRSMPRKLKIS